MARILVLKQTPESEAADMTRRALAPQSVFALACELQRAAFPDDRSYDGPFNPAPLYVTQAFTMWENVTARSCIADLIGALGQYNPRTAACCPDNRSKQ